MVNRSGAAPVADSVEVFKGDLMESGVAEAAAEGASVVYQCANPPYTEWVELFPALQQRAVAAARSANARYVSFENLYAYGDPKGETLRPDRVFNPDTKKGRLRAEMANEIGELAAKGDLELTTVRASNYFGPRGTWQSPFGTHVIGRAMDGKSAQVLGDPDTLHSYSYIPDIGKTLAALGTDDRAVGRVWFVPNAPAETTTSIVGMISQALSRPIKVSAAPELILRVMGMFSPVTKELIEMLYEYKDDYIADGSATTDTFGIAPTPMDDAVSATVEWWLAQDWKSAENAILN
jgi:nucleoside-diphosphate-sugar epimerase